MKKQVLGFQKVIPKMFYDEEKKSYTWDKTLRNNVGFASCDEMPESSKETIHKMTKFTEDNIQ